MSVFVVLSRQSNPKLEAEIKAKFPNDYYKLSNNEWLLCGGGTSIDISRILGIADANADKDKGGDKGLAVVFAISSYYGFETADLWDWVKVKWEKNCD
jgi:hypothetical protein